MSRRTSEASKAIRAAWLKEQKLVSEGKGTRDWTPEQQKEILERGKAYYHSKNPDDVNDGKAFKGHQERLSLFQRCCLLQRQFVCSMSRKLL